MTVPAPAPRTCDPYYEDKPHLVEWLEKGTPRRFVFDTMNVQADLIELDQVVLQKHKAYGFAPYVGDPFVYMWRFATDQYGRSIAGEAHIHYLPWEPWMP